ncbi:uncharacterized protein EURHEDRAFT_404724 [Aspergillus ruber CBS 135680]|uniref:Uncharacterized protein n=1 Tax=Aspergillus ruber (strain CBS 135680) TaxID=1388766 RepID=A0A017S7G3_ASPRC|nr:uncharacterized protein EURHEDRAFT_404724 [Aspergillus ruber CBS 135680]EYE92907.1 hypothetical protein EURHEDRAFT_404724 [Aspergillus ruber CBS 135680]
MWTYSYLPLGAAASGNGLARPGTAAPHRPAPRRYKARRPPALVSVTSCLVPIPPPSLRSHLSRLSDASPAILRDIGPPFPHPACVASVASHGQRRPLPLDDPCAASLSFPTDGPGHSPVASPRPSLGR